MRCLSILAVAAVAWLLAACDAVPNTKSVAELNDVYQKIEPEMAEADLKTVAGEPTKKEPKDEATEWVLSRSGPQHVLPERAGARRDRGQGHSPRPDQLQPRSADQARGVTR